MATNSQENYWQPQDEPETQVAPQPPTPKTASTPKKESTPAANPPKSSVSPTPPLKISPETPSPQETPETDSYIAWEASEIVEHSRGPLWFTGFIVVATLFVAGMLYLQEWLFAALIVVAAVAVIIIARRPPKVMHYELDDEGLSIDDELHAFSEFRAFGVVRDDAFFAIKLIPTKRFSPEIMIYFAEADGEKIVDILGDYLPMEEMKLDLADRLIRKIRL